MLPKHSEIKSLVKYSYETQLTKIKYYFEKENKGSSVIGRTKDCAHLTSNKCILKCFLSLAECL